MLFHWLNLPSYLYLSNHCMWGVKKMEHTQTCSYSMPSSLNFPDSNNKVQGTAQPGLWHTEMLPTISKLADGSSSSSTSYTVFHPSDRLVFSDKDELLVRRFVRQSGGGGSKKKQQTNKTNKKKTPSVVCYYLGS